MTNAEQSAAPGGEMVSVFSAPQWVPVFVALAAVISGVPFLAGFSLGLSVSSDVVFGIYALICGLAADLVLRRKLGRVLVLSRRPRVPFIGLWTVLCVYVIVFQPLA